MGNRFFRTVKCLLVLGGLVPLGEVSHAANFASISLTVMVVDSGGGVIITPSVVANVYSRDFLVVPVTVDATASGTPIAAVTLYARPLGSAAAFAPLDPANGFAPSPAGQTFYQGSARIPGSIYIGGGVEYYIEVVLTNNATYTSGTPASPLITHFVDAYTVTVGPGPAVVILPDGDPRAPNTTLVFPAGALTQPTTIGITMMDPLTPSVARGNAPATSADPAAVYNITPAGLKLPVPMTATLQYPDGDGTPGQVDGTTINETTLRVFWWDGFDWRLLGGTVNAASNTVTVQTDHLGLLALFPVGNLISSDYRPAERIITPNGDGINDVAYFSGLTGEFEIRIYTSNGRLIRVIRDRAEWDGRDGDGRVVKNGTYSYQYRTAADSNWVGGMIGVAR